MAGSGFLRESYMVPTDSGNLNVEHAWPQTWRQEGTLSGPREEEELQTRRPRLHALNIPRTCAKLQCPELHNDPDRHVPLELPIPRQSSRDGMDSNPHHYSYSSRSAGPGRHGSMSSSGRTSAQASSFSRTSHDLTPATSPDDGETSPEARDAAHTLAGIRSPQTRGNPHVQHRKTNAALMHQDSITSRAASSSLTSWPWDSFTSNVDVIKDLQRAQLELTGDRDANGSGYANTTPVMLAGYGSHSREYAGDRQRPSLHSPGFDIARSTSMQSPERQSLSPRDTRPSVDASLSEAQRLVAANIGMTQTAARSRDHEHERFTFPRQASSQRSTTNRSARLPSNHNLRDILNQEDFQQEQTYFHQTDHQTESNPLASPPPVHSHNRPHYLSYSTVRYETNYALTGRGTYFDTSPSNYSEQANPLTQAVVATPGPIELAATPSSEEPLAVPSASSRPATRRTPRQQQKQARRMNRRAGSAGATASSKKADDAPPNWRCEYVPATSRCPHEEAPRKIVSHFLGRNKTFTKRIPGEAWVFYCRRHYQRCRYRNKTNKDGDTWYSVQGDCLFRQLNRMDAVMGDIEWQIKLQKALQSQLDADNARRVGSASDSSPAPDTDKEAIIAAHVAIAREILPRCGNKKTTDDVREVVRIMVASCRNRGLEELPSIEFLPVSWVNDTAT